MNRPLRRLCALACALLLCLTFSCALSVEQALDLLERHYIDPLPAEAYQVNTLNELFTVLGDPYTFYMDAEEFERFNTSLEKDSTVTGIGIGVEFTADGMRIMEFLDGGSAREAGLQLDDYIIAVNGVSCTPAYRDHRDLIVGEPGTTVTVTVRHADGSTQDFSMERKTVVIHNTSTSYADGVGTIDCNSFGSQTAQYVYEGVTGHEDARLWILDLRDNLGGMSESAVHALGVFTGIGPKLVYRQNDGTSYSFYHFEAASTDKPVISLVNAWSASASELLSGGILANDAGIVVGSRTYGKGVAQIILTEENYPELFHGDALKVTGYRFYRADGNTTDRIGVIPTLTVSDAYTADIARLLSGKKPEAGEYYSLVLNGKTFFIDLEAACSEAYLDAFRELLSALPPDAVVVCGSDTAAQAISPALAAQQLGISFDDRFFADVADSRYADEINALAVYGLLSGDGNGQFHPNDTLTRAELCALLSQVLNVTTQAPAPYDDVPAASWYNGPVSAMTVLGFVNGVGEGYFAPGQTLTQAQFITVMGRLSRFLNYTADDYAIWLRSEGASPDESLAILPDWAQQEAAVMTELYDSMLCDDFSDIVPDAPVTREQAAATLFKTLRTLGILSY